MTMHDTDLRLDGNAAAGLLAELFAFEVTEARITCASCGAQGAAGAAHVYAGGPGTVVRCPGCSAVLIRVAHVRGRLVADLRGVAALEAHGAV
jgi:ribosomal protein S27E